MGEAGKAGARFLRDVSLNWIAIILLDTVFTDRSREKLNEIHVLKVNCVSSDTHMALF